MEIKERFGLKRNSLLLDPIQDSDFYAPRSGIDVTELVDTLRVDLEAGITPKMVFWGPYGGGKTHTLGKVQKSLQKLVNVNCIYIRCPTLSERATFAEFYQSTFTDGLGENFTIKLLEELCDKLIRQYGLRDQRVNEEMRKILGDEELAKASSHLSDRSFDASELWRWISGVKLSLAELKRLGVTRSLCDVEPLRLAKIIESIGKLTKFLQDKTLVLAYDEMERISDLRPEAVLTFRTALTHLMDPGQTTVSIFMAYTAASFREIPELMKGPVIDRIGGEKSEAVREIPSLDPSDVESFVKAILKYLRSPEVDVRQRISAKGEMNETLTEELYPFTKEALDEIKGRIASLTPRLIMLTLTRAMSRAHLQNKNVVSSDFID
jgi:hypothetical protein